MIFLLNYFPRELGKFVGFVSGLRHSLSADIKKLEPVTLAIPLISPKLPNKSPVCIPLPLLLHGHIFAYLSWCWIVFSMALIMAVTGTVYSTAAGNIESGWDLPRAKDTCRYPKDFSCSGRLIIMQRNEALSLCARQLLFIQLFPAVSIVLYLECLPNRWSWSKSKDASHRALCSPSPPCPSHHACLLALPQEIISPGIFPRCLIYSVPLPPTIPQTCSQEQIFHAKLIEYISVNQP